jgi:hypothetical protein
LAHRLDLDFELLLERRTVRQGAPYAGRHDPPLGAKIFAEACDAFGAQTRRVFAEIILQRRLVAQVIARTQRQFVGGRRRFGDLEQLGAKETLAARGFPGCACAATRGIRARSRAARTN